jgi:hypothetical protein
MLIARPGAVPEPATMALILAAVPFIFRRCRRANVARG